MEAAMPLFNYASAEVCSGVPTLRARAVPLLSMEPWPSELRSEPRLGARMEPALLLPAVSRARQSSEGSGSMSAGWKRAKDSSRLLNECSTWWGVGAGECVGVGAGECVCMWDRERERERERERGDARGSKR